ncbi:MAG: glycoside hydrolase family 3 N-terminal domain-containing protein [Raoultibacter sp.]
MKQSSLAYTTGIVAGALLIAVLLFSLCVLGSCAPQDSGEGPSQSSAEEQASSPTANNPTTDTPTPRASPIDPLEKRIQDKLATMTLEQKGAQLFILQPEALTNVDVVTQAGNVTKDALSTFPVGGLIYFGKNLTGPDQTRTMLSNTQDYATTNNGLPLFLCVDEEGGTVARIGGNPAYSVPVIGNMVDTGATGDPSQAHTVGVTIGTYLQDLGFTVDFAPDADIANNPEANVMALRSFGSDATLVANMVQAELQGFMQTGVLPCVKHFPGIGSALGDSHDESIATNASIDRFTVSCEQNTA